MQITITQSEIEQAIISYIHEQINVREGMEITVDLAATRGMSGFTATIDVKQKCQPPAEVIPSGPVKRETVARPAMVKPVTVEAPVEVECTATPATEVEAEQTQVTEAAVSDTGIAEGAGKRSLFGNLVKPVNS